MAQRSWRILLRESSSAVKKILQERCASEISLCLYPAPVEARGTETRTLELLSSVAVSATPAAPDEAAIQAQHEPAVPAEFFKKNIAAQPKATPNTTCRRLNAALSSGKKEEGVVSDGVAEAAVEQFLEEHIYGKSSKNEPGVVEEATPSPVKRGGYGWGTPQNPFSHIKTPPPGT